MGCGPFCRQKAPAKHPARGNNLEGRPAPLITSPTPVIVPPVPMPATRNPLYHLYRARFLRRSSCDEFRVGRVLNCGNNNTARIAGSQFSARLIAPALPSAPGVKINSAPQAGAVSAGVLAEGVRHEDLELITARPPADKGQGRCRWFPSVGLNNGYAGLELAFFFSRSIMEPRCGL